MTALALRGLAARRLRTLLTAIAIVLGVAMVSGTYIETDQIRAAFDDITKESVEKLDVIVTPHEEFNAQFSTQMPSLDADLVDRVKAVSGVGDAEGQVMALGNLVVDGEVVNTMGAPPLVMGDGSEEFDSSEVIEGRDPVRAGEAAILEQNAGDQGIEIGDRIGVTTRHGVETVTVTGIFAFGEGGSSMGGATAVELTIPEVQRLYDLEGKVSSISVIAAPGVDPDVLRVRVDAALPAGLKVETAAENAAATSEEINDQIGSFLTPVLLALAGAAVLVGAFIIFNTFSITVAQRIREFAMLRALGATRGQVLAIVAGEALFLGVVASAAGLGLGIGFSKLLNGLFDAVGFGIPRSGLVLEPRTIAASLAVGIGVTLLAALVPALRATQVAPVAAMSGVRPRDSQRKRRIAAALSLVLLAVGVAFAAQGLFGGGTATAKMGSIAGGAVAVFVGVALSARHLVRPLAVAIGYPIERVFRTPGRLARENAERNPSRTAITSAALMVGVGLVVFVAVFAAGVKASISSQVDELMRADLFVYGEGFQPIPAAAGKAIDRVDGVEAVVPTIYDQVEVNGEDLNTATDVLIGVDPTRLADVYAFEWLDGDGSLLANLRRGHVLVEEQFAEQHEIEVGDIYRVVTPSGGRVALTAVGMYRDPTILQGSIATRETLAPISPARDPITILVALEDGMDAAAVQRDVEAALGEFPTAKVENRAEYEQVLDEQLDPIVYMLYALLALSLVISVFGIANSLFLSIHERTGELGVLRAVGATRHQVRRVIRYESVITALIGATLGTLLGVAFAWLVMQSLSEFGFEISIPVGQLVAFMLLAVAVGVVGAVGPARRAARVNVLDAVRYE